MGLDSLKFEKVRNKEKLTSKNGKNFVITTFQTDYLSSNTWPILGQQLILKNLIIISF